ncbi:hypothetical protein J4225_04015 [Candidatus Pacearchaeota archaeon]|nr:hypothetical protein [Candidatus Pacearchaeota archaeon]
MNKKINKSWAKKTFVLVLSLFIIVAASVFIYSAVPGVSHTSDEIFLDTSSCGSVTLKYAIDNNCLPSSATLNCAEVSVRSATTNTATAACSAGYIAVSGGCASPNGDRWTRLLPEDLNSDGIYESFVCSNNLNDVTAKAICCKLS